MQTDRTPVSIRNCAKTYPDGTQGLLPTDIDINPGEVLALLGPSGCGKTTLLRIIAGLESPDAGARVYFGEDDVTHLPVEQRNIGMVFQQYALFPNMDVAANIGYGLRIRGIAPALIRQRVGELLELVRLEDLAHKRPAELSGGQRQRVALARAIAVRPRVLLLDEPLAALDAKLKESLRDELAALLRHLHITAIHVTHDQQEAMSIADRLAVMASGRIIQVGSAEDLYRAPRHAFVASFLGRVNTLTLSTAADGSRGVLLAGLWLKAGDGLSEGSSVLLRPEDVKVHRTDNPTTHARSALVQQRMFLGDRIRLRILTPEDIELTVDADRDCALAVGDSVVLQVDPNSLLRCGELQ